MFIARQPGLAARGSLLSSILWAQVIIGFMRERNLLFYIVALSTYICTADYTLKSQQRNPPSRNDHAISPHTQVQPSKTTKKIMLRQTYPRPAARLASRAARSCCRRCSATFISAVSPVLKV